MLLERVRDTIDRYRMLRPGGTVLVAVSGGIDSVVLLDLLARLAPDYGVHLEVAHLDHGLRGRASADDARFVGELAGRMGIAFHTSRVDLGAPRAGEPSASEAAARDARLDFLQSVAQRIGAQTIALGHHANDQAETVLHRLARGAGPTGLRGIPPVRTPYVRPLIESSHGDIQAYARERGLTWRDDVTNADPAYARNRIRHRVVPELEAINPRAVEAIARASLLTAEADEANRFLVSTLWDGVCSEQQPERLLLRRNALIPYPSAVRNLLLREAIRRVRGDLARVDHDHVDALARMVASDAAHGELSLPGLFARMQADELLLARKAETPVEPWSYAVDIGETGIPDPPMSVRLAIVGDPAPAFDTHDRWSEIADADRIGRPLRIRSRRDGDRFVPLGLGKSVKLKDFLINERVPYFDRARVPVLCDRKRIVWVVGVRLSDEVRVTDRTTRYLSMQVRERT